MKNFRIFPCADAVLGSAVFLYFLLAYPAHILCQEQYQLFEWTWGYFLRCLQFPGGFADWTGRFLSQFFISALAGAAVAALLLVALRRLCGMLSRQESTLGPVLSYIPAILMLVYLLDDRSIYGAPVALLLTLLSAVFVRSLKPGKVITLVLAPALYFLCGPVSIIYALLLPKGEKLYVKIIAPCLVFLMPLLCAPVMHMTLRRLFLGVHYYRLPALFPTWFWISALSVPVVCRIWLKQPGKKPAQNAVAIASLAVLAICSFFVVKSFSDMSREDAMRYDQMSARQDWSGILKRAHKNAPDKTLTLCCANLALAKEGRLADELFTLPQSGEFGLFPKYSISYNSLLPTAEIFWQLGFVNACQQYVFESQEAIPDYQKSARCYKMLAETNIVNSDYGVAKKYLASLNNTLFYRKWAKERLSILGDEAKVNEVYGEQRKNRDNDPIALFNESHKDAMLESLLAINPGNSLAREYLLCLDLLQKNLAGFQANLKDADKLPKLYQEALILSFVEQKQRFESLPSSVSMGNVNRMKSFIQDMRKGAPDSYMKKQYGDTYWFYSIFE